MHASLNKLREGIPLELFRKNKRQTIYQLGLHMVAMVNKMNDCIVK